MANEELKYGKPASYVEGVIRPMISPNVKPEVAELMLEYALTPEQHADALSKIGEYCFAGKTPVENPIIYLVISQTGGGKSNLSSSVLANNPNTVVIDSDAFKAFNPRREEIVKQFPTLYGFLTGPDAYMHRDEIYSKALSEGYNVLIEVAPSTKERLFNIDFAELERYGYTVNSNILAVSQLNSLLSVHERYEGQIESGMKNPKLTDLKRAQDSFVAVRLILEDLINMPDVAVNVYRRCAFSESETERTRILPPVLITSDKSSVLYEYDEAIKQDQEITLESADERISMVRDSMNNRNAPTDQRAQFAKIEEIAKDLEQQRK